MIKWKASWVEYHVLLVTGVFLQRVQKRLCFTDVIDFQLIVTFDSPFEWGKKENMIWSVQISFKVQCSNKNHVLVGSTLCGWFHIVRLVPNCVVGSTLCGWTGCNSG